MRWGVRDEATDDHMTTELCMREIKNCQRLSMGPNFVVSSQNAYDVSFIRHVIRLWMKRIKFLNIILLLSVLI